MTSFVVTGHDNGLYFFRGRADVRRCPKCGMLTHKWQEPLGVDVATGVTADVSTSYDGVLIASTRFVELYQDSGMLGLQFAPVGAGQWALHADRIVKFDSSRRRTRFEQRCDRCGRFREIAGATPAFLLPTESVAPMEFVRTDVEFGSGDEQHPLMICGAEAASTLRSARMRWLELTEVREAPPVKDGKTR